MNNILFRNVLSFSDKQMKVANRSYKRPIFVVTSAYKMNGVRKPLFVVEKNAKARIERENSINKANKKPHFIVTKVDKQLNVRKPLFVVEKSNPVSAEQENQVAQDLVEATVFSFAGSQKDSSLDESKGSQQTGHFGE